MKRSLLFLLVGFVSFAKAQAFPPALVGKWKLKARECETGALTEFGKQQQPAGASEEVLIVSADGNEEYRLREFGAKPDPAKYCETIYKGKWSVQGGKILKFSSTLDSRKGTGGYTCYKTTFPKTQTSDRDWPYKLDGDHLRVTHNDIAIKIAGTNEIKKTCENSEHSIEVYERQH